MKNKITALRSRRVLNRYFFFQEEYDLKEEMLNEMDIEFREALDIFLKENPEIEKMYQDRLKEIQEQAYQKYKKEYEEQTGIVLSDSKELVLYVKPEHESTEEDFFEEEAEEEEEPDSSESKSEEKNTDKATRNKYKKLFREIVKLTHPDRVKDEQRNKLYVKATKAFEEGNYVILISIAAQLGIEYEADETLERNIKETVDEIQKKITLMEKSVVWIWYSTDAKEAKNHVMFTYLRNILQQV